MRLSFYLIFFFSLVSFRAFTAPNLLPEPVTNNAVAKVTLDDQAYALSFMGLGADKTHKAVHNKVWALNLATNRWQQKSSVPSTLPLKGRLASIAVGIGSKAYVFGGYTVAEDHSEISSPDNFVYDLKTDSYQFIAPTPVPTDDAVALVYQNRYIYLISGWHNDGNVNLVQMYNVETNQWRQASPFLGEPVFGHAGGIWGNNLLVCDGVKVKAQHLVRRTFSSVAACYSGQIDPQAPFKIDWRKVEHPTGEGRYRMAASGAKLTQGVGVVFAGGSLNPYNYNGIGYNGVPSEASRDIWFYNFERQVWQFAKAPKATMDHRGLVPTFNMSEYLILGGMGKNQEVLNSVTHLALNNLDWQSSVK
ncbi:Kelch repeat-containing protein [Alteromonas sp. a30]|uniref:Kelch repeat-containing protein n=1 Tax=Alteromonas sp. a30 TaxID=2730917 RepID=UPI00227FCEE4|nr:galactose oxidase [Alteromonas sp. a30]MCY7295288.1 galactose oxidase [Alteromonas sp. a30]